MAESFRTVVDYITDSGDEVAIVIKYENSQGFPVSPNDRLQDGGFSLNQVASCAIPIDRRILTPRYIFVNHGNDKRIRIWVRSLERWQQILAQPDNLQSGIAIRYYGESFRLCSLT